MGEAHGSQKFEEVGSDVPTTNLYDTPGPGPDSAAVVEAYSSRPGAPANLDFEGLTSTSQAALTWLRENRILLAAAARGAEPNAPAR